MPKPLVENVEIDVDTLDALDEGTLYDLHHLGSLPRVYLQLYSLQNRGHLMVRRTSATRVRLATGQMGP